MALDHYISQVHLRNFYSPELGDLMHAIRKSDLRNFRCKSENVCRIEQGSTNTYLTHHRAIEDFLREIEPKYNSSLNKLRSGSVDTQCILSIAGFIAYIGCCSPAAMRIHTSPLESQLTSIAKILDRQGVLTKAPPELGGKSLPELLAEGTVHYKIDPKFPQAVGVSTVVGRTSIYGNSAWEILHNDTDSAYFTSDYPLAIERSSDLSVPNWIVPLAPDLALRIFPDPRLSRAAPDLAFSKFSYRRRAVTRREVVDLNRLIVRCAEDLIFFRDSEDWIEVFVSNNRNFRVEVVTESVPHGTGFLNISTQKIVRHERT